MVRFKNRYLLVELVWGDGMVDSSISAENLKREVKHQIQLNFGDFGVGLVQATLQGTPRASHLPKAPYASFFFFSSSSQSLIIRSCLSSVKYWNHLTNLCIIRCARDYYKMVWTAVTMINTLNQRSVLFRLVHLGGTAQPPPATATTGLDAAAPPRVLQGACARARRRPSRFPSGRAPRGLSHRTASRQRKQQPNTPFHRLLLRPLLLLLSRWPHDGVEYSTPRPPSLPLYITIKLH